MMAGWRMELRNILAGIVVIARDALIDKAQPTEVGGQLEYW
jgi:hypothetical protein